MMDYCSGGGGGGTQNGRAIPQKERINPRTVLDLYRPIMKIVQHVWWTSYLVCLFVEKANLPGYIIG